MTAIIICIIGITALGMFNGYLEHRDHKRIDKELETMKSHLERIMAKENVK